jgi:uncharacterized protein
VEKGISRAVILLGLLLALGMSSAAFILGNQTRGIGSGRQSITVKGLAEKPVKADYAEWNIGVQAHGQTFADALAKLRKERPLLLEFLARQGFEKESIAEMTESVTPNMVEEELPNNRSRTVQKGFNASQSFVVTTKDLARAAAAAKAALQLEAEGSPVFYSAPTYLVSDLEEIKMSLIGAATQNAQKRAEEFAKNGNAKVGSMRSASQGAFYILAPGRQQEATEYGGTYDKTTVDKIARVVVTIEYNIEK